MNPERRALLRTALVLSGAVAMPRSVLLHAPTGVTSQPTDLFSRMSWFNEPASFKVSGTELEVHSRPKSDFWRKTFYGYTTDNGHFFHLPAVCGFIRPGWLDGPSRRGELDEKRHGVLRRKAPRERGFYPGLLRLVHDARSLGDRPGMVESRSPKRRD